MGIRPAVIRGVGMRRVTGTIFAVIAIIVVLFIRSQALAMGAPPIFSWMPILMILLIIVGVVRTWLRG
jgi:predicted ABC-type exoprotein transport system permease subunit